METATTYFKKVQAYPGWIYDSYNKDYISPKGRTASHPGGVFTGSVSEKQHHEIKRLAAKVPAREKALVKDSPQKYKEEIVDKELKAEIVKTITLGSVTVNWIRVV